MFYLTQVMKLILKLIKIIKIYRAILFFTAICITLLNSFSHFIILMYLLLYSTSFN